LTASVTGLLVNEPADGAQAPSRRSDHASTFLPADALRAGGLEAHEALLPVSDACADGYRLLKEYAACPARFLSVRIGGLARAWHHVRGPAFELVIGLSSTDPALESGVDASNFVLHATPAINLVPRRADRIDLDPRQDEFRVVPDRARPDDHEVVAVTAVTGFDRSGVICVREFSPLYAIAAHREAATPGPAWFAMRRSIRLAGQRPNEVRRSPSACTTVASDVWLSLCDPHEPPWPASLSQIAVEMLCSDRDRPLHLPPGNAAGWHLEDDAPVRAVRCVRDPSPPLAPLPEGDATWALLAHVSSNLRSIVESPLVEDDVPAGRAMLPSGSPDNAVPAVPSAAASAGAAALRELLHLHAHDPVSPLRREIDGIVGLRSRVELRRLPISGPMVFARGVAVELTVDERAFAGASPHVLASILERLLARHATLNSFVELTLCSTTRGLMKTWPARLGTRPLT
jgi:type VI secretion system protein ImpG